MKDTPNLSIVICTYNRSEMLGNCLNSLASQTSGALPHEVIIVDNDSTDDTPRVVQKYMEKISGLRHVNEPQIGLSQARNRGWAEAQGQYLIYLDDDVIVPSEYLLNVSKVISEYQPDITGGPIYPYYTSPKPSWFKDEFEIRCYARESGFSQTCSISGGNYIIKRNVLKELGLFDPAYGMLRGDIQIGMLEEYKVLYLYRQRVERESQKVYYSLEAKVFHHVNPDRMNLKYMLRRRWTAGKAWFRLEFQGGPVRHVIWTLFMAPLRMARGVLRNILKYGANSTAPFIFLCRDIFYYTGFVAGLLSRKPSNR